MRVIAWFHRSIQLLTREGRLYEELHLRSLIVQTSKLKFSEADKAALVTEVEEQVATIREKIRAGFRLHVTSSW